LSAHFFAVSRHWAGGGRERRSGNGAIGLAFEKAFEEFFLELF
jgi:hypothetical protein